MPKLSTTDPNALSGGGGASSAPRTMRHFADVPVLDGQGQSNQAGYDEGDAALTTTARYGVIMPDTGAIIPAELQTTTAPTSFVPAVERPLISHTGVTLTETSMVAAGQQFVSRLSDWAPIGSQGITPLVVTSARGGIAMSGIDKPGPLWDDTIANFTVLRNIAWAQGKTIGYEGAHIGSGEADQRSGTTISTFISLTQGLCNDLKTDLNALFQFTTEPLFFTDQVASHLYYAGLPTSPGPPRPNMALAQLQMLDSIPNMFGTCPSYIHGYNADTPHYNSLGKLRKAYHHARNRAAVTKAKATGTAIPPLIVRPKSIMWSNGGALLDIQLEVPVLPLVWDTDHPNPTVAPITNRGFQARDVDGLTILAGRIASVTIVGDRVRLAFNPALTIGQSVNYAFGDPASMNQSGRTSGPRGELRDSAGDADFFMQGATVVPVHNFCWMFEVVRTA